MDENSARMGDFLKTGIQMPVSDSNVVRQFKVMRKLEMNLPTWTDNHLIGWNLRVWALETGQSIWPLTLHACIELKHLD